MIDSDPKAWSAQKSRQRAVTSFVQLFGGSMSYNYIPRHTEEEYKKYAPNEYKRAGIVLNVAVFFIAVFLIVIAYVVYLAYNTDSTDNISSWVAWSLLFFFAMAIIGIIAHQGMSASLDYSVDNAILKERDALHTQVAKMENDIKSVADRVRDIKAAGLTVTAGDGTTVIIGSDVSNSFNVVRNNDPALADALQTISGAVEKSGNKEAGEAWARFMKQAVGERDKTILSALWDRVVKLVPDVSKLVESVAKIAALFA